MAINEQLANRVRELLEPCGKPVREQKMFSGICFMVDEKMCVGVQAERIMLRLDPQQAEKAVEQPGCQPMIHGGRTMSGYVFIDAEVLKTKKQLEHWVQLALDFNPYAKASKRNDQAAA